MNAIDFLTRQHRRIEHAFDKLGRLAPGDTAARVDVFARLAEALALHMQLEEGHIYPRAEALRRPDASDAARGEHATLKERLAEMLELDPGDPLFDARLKDLRIELERHVEEEERELFPLLEKAVPEPELLELGVTMAEEARARGEPAEGEVAPSLLLH